MLPMLHSVLSDAPLAGHSFYPIPECYRDVVRPGGAQEKIAIFTDQTLLFIFETEPRTVMQALVAEELEKRGFVYDEDVEKWRTPSGKEWDPGRWKEIEGQGMGVVIE
jgi:hypothetical protein